MDKLLFEWFNPPNKSESHERLEDLDNVQNFYFINSDKIKNGKNSEFITNKLDAFLGWISPEDIQVIHSPTTKSRKVWSSLKKRWYDVIEHAQMSVSGISKKITKSRKKEALSHLLEELWEECSQFITASGQVQWNDIRRMLHEQWINVTIFGTTLSKNFLRYIDQTWQDFEEIFYRLYTSSLWEETFDDKIETWKNYIYRRQSWRKKVTVFIGEENFWRVLESTFEESRRQKWVSISDKRNKKLLLPLWRDAWEIQSFKKIPTVYWTLPLVRQAIKVKNKLLNIYTNPNLLFTPDFQEEVQDLLQPLYSRSENNNPKAKIYTSLIYEIELLVEKIKHIQIWHVIHKVKKYIDGRLRIEEPETREVSNLDIKRRVWGKLLLSNIDIDCIDEEVREMIIQLSEFVDSTVWRKYFQTISDILKINPREILSEKTANFEWWILLEYILVDILNSQRSKKIKWQFTKWSNEIDLYGQTDFVFQWDNWTSIWYQLFSGSKKSRQPASKLRKLKRLQTAINNGEKTIEMNSWNNTTVFMNTSSLPDRFVFSHLELTASERKALKSYYDDFDAVEDDSVLDNRYDDILSEKILVFSWTLQEVNRILYQKDQKAYEKLLNWGIHISGATLQWCIYDDHIEIIVKHAQSYIWSFYLLNTNGLKCKISKKIKKPKKEQATRKNGRWVSKRRRWMT